MALRQSLLYCLLSDSLGVCVVCTNTHEVYALVRTLSSELLSLASRCSSLSALPHELSHTVPVYLSTLRQR
jgi:hypothetical protein